MVFEEALGLDRSALTGYSQGNHSSEMMEVVQKHCLGEAFSERNHLSKVVELEQE